MVAAMNGRANNASRIISIFFLPDSPAPIPLPLPFSLAGECGQGNNFRSEIAVGLRRSFRESEGIVGLFDPVAQHAAMRFDDPLHLGLLDEVVRLAGICIHVEQLLA